MKVVAAFINSEQASLAAARLESAGIEVEIRDANTVSMNWLWAPAIGGIKVAVPDENVADARLILDAPAESEGILKCPHCGSSDGAVRTLSPVAAILLAFNIPVPFELQKANCRQCGRSYGITAHPHWQKAHSSKTAAAEIPLAR
jgi:ribosomal protein S14